MNAPPAINGSAGTTEKPLADLEHERVPTLVLGTSTASVPPRVWLFVILFSLGFIPSIVAYGLNLWTREPYQFFPLALLGAAFLAWHRLNKGVPAGNDHSFRFGYVLLGGGGLILAAASFLWSPWLGCIATIVTLIGLAWLLGGWTLVRTLMPAFLMLIILIRPPLNWDEKLTLGLRHLAVQLSSCLLDTVFMVPHYISGNVIEVPRQRLLVEEACSGINSTLYAIAFALFWALWRQRSIPHVVLLCLASPSFVLLGNLCRISGVTALKYYKDVDLLVGWRHQGLALGLLAFYMVLIMTTDSLLAFFAASEKVAVTATSARSAGQQLRGCLRAALKAAPWRWVYGLAVCFALLGVVQSTNAWIEIRRKQAKVGAVDWVKRDVPVELRQGAQFDLPSQVGGWQRMESTNVYSNFLELLGLYTHAWPYRKGRITAWVALDYPYAGFHDLRLCYQGQGWKINGTSFQGHPSKDANPYLEVSMGKKPLSYGLLLFAGFTGSGNWVNDLDTKKRPAIATRLGLDSPIAASTTYEVQLLVNTYAPLTEGEKLEVQGLFLEMRNLLATQVLKSLGKKP